MCDDAFKRWNGLHRFKLTANPLDRITSLALKNLSCQEPDLLWAIMLDRTGKMGSRELSQREDAACAAWRDSAEVEAQRMGFGSFAEVERIAQRRW